MVLQKTGSVRLTTSCSRISIVELDGLEYSVDAEKDTSPRVQAKITPGHDVFVILDAVLRIHPHEIRTALPNTLFERSPVQSFDLNTMRRADIHSGVSIRKSQKMQPGLFTINLVPFLLVGH